MLAKRFCASVCWFYSEIMLAKGMWGLYLDPEKKWGHAILYGTLDRGFSFTDKIDDWPLISGRCNLRLGTISTHISNFVCTGLRVFG